MTFIRQHVNCFTKKLFFAVRVSGLVCWIREHIGVACMQMCTVRLFFSTCQTLLLFLVLSIFRYGIFSSCPHSNHLHILTFLLFRSWTTIFGMSIFSRYRGQFQGYDVQWWWRFQVLHWIKDVWLDFRIQGMDVFSYEDTWKLFIEPLEQSLSKVNL